MPEPAIRIVLADDHAIVLHGLHRLFQQYAEFQVVACCRDGREVLDVVRRGGVDVLILDLRMPRVSGLDVLRTMAAESIRCRTVLLTAAVDDAQAVEALRLGAMGLVLKESAPDDLIECARRVHAGEQWFERQTMARAVGRMLKKEEATREVSKLLTPRELEIVKMIAEGLRNRVVASRLAISEGTVKIHLHNIYEKLGIDGRLELAIWAQKTGIL